MDFNLLTSILLALLIVRIEYHFNKQEENKETKIDKKETFYPTFKLGEKVIVYGRFGINDLIDTSKELYEKGLLHVVKYDDSVQQCCRFAVFYKSTIIGVPTSSDQSYFVEVENPDGSKSKIRVDEECIVKSA